MGNYDGGDGDGVCSEDSGSDYDGGDNRESSDEGDSGSGRGSSDEDAGQGYSSGQAERESSSDGVTEARDEITILDFGGDTRSTRDDAE